MGRGPMVSARWRTCSNASSHENSSAFRKGEQRSQYKIKGMERAIKTLEEENKKLREGNNGRQEHGKDS